MKIYLSLAFLFVFFGAYAQSTNSNSSVTISGTVVDAQTQEPVELAGIRILNSKDSTYVKGVSTNSFGKFNVPINRGKYILHASYLGYTDSFISVNAIKSQNDLGLIQLSADGIMLSEAVVTAKAPEIVVKGDTVEYSAALYNVQESAVLEDLIKKIPGAEVGDDGKITINGKDISKILVDGKEFFSNDPKIASKNLPAKMIEKLQVLDKKSEMAEMTGFDDGDEETVINLTVKPGMKEGVFGKAMAGYGSKDRYESNAMVNYMRNDTQLSALGGLNNTNNAGFTDFASGMGGDGGPPRGVRFGGNNGVAKAGNLGLNFATEKGEKFKINGDVRYGLNDNEVKSESHKINTGANRTENSNSWGNNKTQNLGSNFRMEWNPDTLTRIIFRPEFQYNKNRKEQTSFAHIIDENEMDMNQDIDSYYYSDGDGINLNGSLWMSRKLNSKGRSINLRLSGGLDNSDSDGYNYSNTNFYENPLRNDSVIDQRFTTDNKGNNWRSRLSYIEPLGRNNFVELTYDIRNTTSEVDKKSYSKDDPMSDLYDKIDTAYTRRVKNMFLNQKISVSFRSVRKNFNYLVGIGLEPSRSKTEIAEPQKDLKIIPAKSYLNIAPRARFNYMWSKRHNLRIDYRGRANSPTALQLYDGISSQSGFNKTVGNSKLRPSFSNNITIRYQKFVPEKSASMMLFGNFTQTSNDVVSTIQYDSIGQTNSYANVNGNWNGNLRFIINTPLKNKKFSINSMSYVSYDRSNALINDRKSDAWFKNTANTYRLRESLGLRFRTELAPAHPGLWDFEFNVRGNISFVGINNSISTNQNKNTYDYGGYADFSLTLPFNFRIDSDVTYSANSGYGEGFSRNEWLWNASVSKDIFRAKNGTIRFKMYDILQERSNVSRRSDAGSIEDIRTNTINSYFMASFTYTFQMFKGGVKADDMQRSGYDRHDRPRGGGSGRGYHRF